MKNIAVILSGGSGTRFGGNKPKQFAKLAGRSVLEYTIDCFEQSADIHEIIIVSQIEYVDDVWRFVNQNSWKKVSKIVHGGKERFNSSFSALKSLTNIDGESKILFHDAVRPLLSKDIITRCLIALDSFDAVDVVIPSADTLVEVYDNECISNIPNRSAMRRGQTPQAFKLRTIKQAYEKAISMGKFKFTCDCGVVRNMLPETQVITVEGSEKNIKITHPIDLFIAEKLLQERYFTSFNDSIDFGFLRDKNIVIFGGNSGIGFEIMKEAITHGAVVHISSRSHNGVDVVDINSVKNYIKTIIKNHGDIDYVINTTGYLIKKPLEGLTCSEVSSLVNINYLGAINIAIAVKTTLKKTQGTLLNFTSSSYTRGRAFYSIYSSAKAAIVNFTQALADEWIVDNIKVNCINPERTATPMRLNNFGVEPVDSLLDPKFVAIKSLESLAINGSGCVIDVRKDNNVS